VLLDGEEAQVQLLSDLAVGLVGCRKQPEHLERLITKLEVSDRTQAAAKALDLGLVDPERVEE
jgi:hypothetical protein